jgi:hypothetical protein
MGTLQLTDGTTTIDFLDGSTFYLARGGWEPHIARENEAGDDYDDVVEIIKVNWLQTTDDSRDSTLHNIHRLALKAREYHRLRKTSGQVWLKANTHSETNPRYALVKSVDIENLDARHWGPNRGVDLVLTIIREGAWRDTIPNTVPFSYPEITSNTIYNQVDGGQVNYVDVAAATLTGDARMLPIFMMPFNSKQSKVIIGVRSRGSSGDVTPFNPHFNAVNVTDTTYRVVDASAPGGYRWERVIGGGSGNITNAIPLPANLQYYTGTFLVYAICKATTSVWTLQLAHGTSSTFPSINLGEVMSIGVTTNFQQLYLGRITLPPAGEIPGLGNPTNYYLNLKAAYTALGTFSLRNLFIVPTDEGVFEVANMGAQRVAADSILERSWHYDSANRYVENQPTTRGRFISLKPNNYTRMMFFFSRSDADGGVNPDDNMADVTMRGTIRYLGLRGNT